MIFKVIWWSVKIIAVCFLVAIISNQEGITEIEWIGWKMEVPTSILIGGLIILILIILWIYNLWKIILNLPSKIFRIIRENRQKNGYNALAYGLVASSAGDVESAQKYAAQAKRLLDNKELTEMLSAHAAHLSGDKNAALEYFNSLSERKNTKFHGQLGLMRLAIESNNHDEALDRARIASNIQPRNPKLNSMLVIMEAKHENYEKSIEALQKARRIGSIEETRAQQLAASLYTKIGLKKLEENELNEAEKSLSLALREKTDFIPAVIALSKILIGKENQRKALSLLTKTWKVQPHPEIAKTLKLIWKNERSSSNIANLINLTDDNAKAQARYIIADEAISAGLAGEAKDQLNKVLSEEYNTTYYQLKSRLAYKSDDKTTSNQELEKALNAPPSQRWGCSSCGITAETWEIRCNNCDKIGTLNWI